MRTIAGVSWRSPGRSEKLLELFWKHTELPRAIGAEIGRDIPGLSGTGCLRSSFLSKLIAIRAR
ncbi:hypothetical protein JMJ77_0008435 [Colletotrichum scovillei]|uniref:Uncharacterized protein n=1 Tax=Colletotrichum scovillei TaxID=1209932 RepID=A0A9P7RI62_9PEZI|nr:hypothetical protein JMJ77_0008435 [Colletotrichum scovillei]KAG7075428.1 hypothetical protein JMJ76_0011888 [Colletotrichum scovillei]KAG7082437.1 hypothetical protein JMJ78_0004539 [Colletotrichum scovillei]